MLKSKLLAISFLLSMASFCQEASLQKHDSVFKAIEYQINRNQVNIKDTVEFWDQDKSYEERFTYYLNKADNKINKAVRILLSSAGKNKLRSTIVIWFLEEQPIIFKKQQWRNEELVEDVEVYLDKKSIIKNDLRVSISHVPIPGEAYYQWAINILTHGLDISTIK